MGDSVGKSPIKIEKVTALTFFGFPATLKCCVGFEPCVVNTSTELPPWNCCANIEGCAGAAPRGRRLRGPRQRGGGHVNVREATGGGRAREVR
eukprot:SAG31_NODE_1363_length_8627_cov_5.967402_13_plen_93_part_00